MGVEAWEEDVVIPTYEIGKPEKNPIFLEKRVYQGSSGAVYPYPVVEKIENNKSNKTYHAIFLENEYIKIMILPELGGRVQMAFDKLKNRHFIYYNQVIKPALVGLTGPWISGGIEFNWPQHHRPSTFLPIDYAIERNNDGSITVWVNEYERMTHQKGMAGFTLYPSKAFLEIKGRLYNPTPIPQTFLWWANPAVAVNDHYQSVFPPDVHAVFDHGKRDVSTFPIATGTYYKIDYSAGVDISNYKNIPVPTSYMAINSAYNFVGGYENDTQAGVLHVANHHISPGKKQWTWGNGDFGKAWDKNLTDEDGPYIELMAGVFTDNQPDFAWINPFEEKRFTQYFLPYRELGVVKNASKDILMNLEKEGTKAIIKIFATSVHKKVRIVLSTFFEEIVDLKPEQVFTRDVEIGNTSLSELKLSVLGADDREILSITPEQNTGKQTPEAAKEIGPPSSITTSEQLYLAGLHLEQYRHATYSPTDYYLEALRRDPADIRCNNAMGLWLLRRGKFSDSEAYFRKAIQSQTNHNPNPYDGEALFNLGLSLKFQGKFDEAYNSFYKSCWNAAMQDAGYLECARISCIRGNFSEALEEIDKSLIRNWHNHTARSLKSSILRMLGNYEDALVFIDESLKIDLFNFQCHFEKYLITRDPSALEQMHNYTRKEVHNYEVVALDYIDSGFYESASILLEIAINTCVTTPLTYYYLGWSQALQNKDSEIVFRQAMTHAPEYCFPNRLESILALECALSKNAKDSKALYYLGNLWFDKRQYDDAISCWEKSVKVDNSFPTALRNLALAYFNKKHQHEKARICLETAFSLDPTDARLLMELDQLYKRLGYFHIYRLEFLEKYTNLVESRDDLYLERATLYNQIGEYSKAKNLIDRRQFHPWEGGEGKVSTQYQLCRIELAKKAITANEFEVALDFLMQCLTYPDNLGEGKLHGAQENDIHYYLGCVYKGLNQTDNAILHWNIASEGSSDPIAAIYYNDQKPDKIFYQGLALLKLGRNDEAKIRFEKLITYGKTHFRDVVKLDYFAVSLPDLLIWEDDLTLRNKVHCDYMIGLGLLGQGLFEKAKSHFDEAYRKDINHQGVQIHRNFC